MRSDCPEGERCVAAGASMCGEPGICIRVLDCGFDPVCGCDGVTYTYCSIPDGVLADHDGPCE